MTNTPYIDALEDSNRPPKKRKTIVHAVQSAVLATSLSLGVSVDAQAQKAPDTVVATTKKPQKVKKTQKKVKKPPVSEITVPVKPKTRKVSRVRTEEMKWSYADVIGLIPPPITSTVRIDMSKEAIEKDRLDTLYAKYRPALYLELLALLDKKEDIILLVERAKSLGDVDFLRRLTLLQYDASYVSDEEAERNFSTLIRTSLEEAQTIAEGIHSSERRGIYMAIIAAHVAQIQVEAEKAAVAAKVEAEKARMAQSPKITQKTQAVEVLLRQPVLRDDEGAKDFDAWQARPERKVFLLSQFALGKNLDSFGPRAREFSYEQRAAILAHVIVTSGGIPILHQAIGSIVRIAQGNYYTSLDAQNGDLQRASVLLKSLHAAFVLSGQTELSRQLEAITSSGSQAQKDVCLSQETKILRYTCYTTLNAGASLSESEKAKMATLGVFSPLRGMMMFNKEQGR